MLGMNTGLEGKRTLHDTGVFERNVLPNGVTVWLQKLDIQHDRKGIVMACLPNIGGICDPPDMPGLAHFFEHAPFLGTEDRPSYEAVWSPIDDLSGNLNASTSKLVIRYHCTLPQEYFRLAAETVFQLAVKPSFRDEDVIVERGNILRERKDRLSNGATAAAWAAAEAVFGKPFGIPVIGYPETISAVTGEHIREFFRRYFRTGNLHVVVGGAFAWLETIPIIEELFGSLPALPADPPIKVPLPREGRREVLVNPAFGTDSISISWVLDGDVQLAARIIAEELAADMTSPLVALFRRKMGSMYSTGWASAKYLWGDTVVGMTIPIDGVHFPFAEHAVREEIQKITPERIIRRQKIAQYDRDYNCPHPVQEVIGAPEDLLQVGRIRSLHEYEEKEDYLTVEEVLRVRDLLLETPPIICETRI